MRQIDYLTQGTCSRMIHVELDDDDVIREVAFVGGCNGNTKGVSALVKGQKAQDVIGRVRGIRCGNRPTSCPDQLSLAIEQCLNQPR